MSDDQPPYAQRRHCDLTWPYSRKEGCTEIMRDHGWKDGEEICPPDLPEKPRPSGGGIILCTDLRSEP